jgi:hypothetical protein
MSSHAKYNEILCQSLSLGVKNKIKANNKIRANNRLLNKVSFYYNNNLKK